MNIYDQACPIPKANRLLPNAYMEYNTAFTQPFGCPGSGSFQNNAYKRQNGLDPDVCASVPAPIWQNRDYPYCNNPIPSQKFFEPFNVFNPPSSTLARYGESVRKGVQRGRNATNQRAGAGGGGGNSFNPAVIPNSRSGGAGGGRGGAGNAGQAGTAGGAGNPGSAATPSTVNCVPVTPGTNAPIVVGAPGGQIVISWNPQ
jgi:hypothetical protein